MNTGKMTMNSRLATMNAKIATMNAKKRIMNIEKTTMNLKNFSEQFSFSSDTNGKLLTKKSPDKSIFKRQMTFHISHTSSFLL